MNQSFYLSREEYKKTKIYAERIVLANGESVAILD